MNAPAHSAFINNQGANIHGHPNLIFSNTYTMWVKMLEGSLSSMRNPLSVLYANMNFLEVIPCNVLSMSTFVSNRSLIGPCIHDISVHEFFWGLQSVFTIIGSHLHHSGSPSWIILYLGSNSYTVFQHSIHNIKTIKHFRRDSYPIPSYLVPHRHEHFYTYFGC